MIRAVQPDQGSPAGSARWQSLLWIAGIALIYFLVARFTKRYLHKDGSIVWADVSTSLRRDNQGTPLYLMTTLLNITEREHPEQALLESEKRYQKLASISPVGIFRTDQDSNTTYVNPKWCKISGLSELKALAVVDV